ncbi:nucleoside deaminase [Belliella kenyensis]|uniref:Nucleoside deaminase n=1 Tax=Belliella kenyensis TaxID=1472724 RepID=A0ABV8ELZ8_9BACT|nr:nucleoside deaminase [Belliella kenyensis]MCH7403590.1 nucleoside deaminase [Belliella kenyensis]MDN3603858.1 nucleoside deaminase [Belliella kenyensis]
MTEQQKSFMKQAIELSQMGMDSGVGGPFGCVIVKNGQIIGKGSNAVSSTNDPTAHAEVVAIRDACKNLNSFQLEGCELYTSCEPCPMCLGAIYWARPSKVYYANTKKDAAAAGFDDQFIYEELELPLEERSIPFHQFMRDDAKGVFENWIKKENKTVY